VSDRPEVPAALKRRLMVEAGHRCAIPTCRATVGLVYEHIDDWAKVKRHGFEDMIVICSNCHSRKGNRHGQIDRKALRQYKANLAVINSRYSDVERRVLDVFAQYRLQLPANPDRMRSHAEACWPEATAIQMPGSLGIMMVFLLQDGLVKIALRPMPYVRYKHDRYALMPTPRRRDGQPAEVDYYVLTDKGVTFLDAWLGAQPLDDVAENEEVVPAAAPGHPEPQVAEPEATSA
jgi:hypothetical protein